MKEYSRVIMGCIVGLVIVIACIWLMLSISRAGQRNEMAPLLPVNPASER